MSVHTISRQSIQFCGTNHTYLVSRMNPATKPSSSRSKRVTSEGSIPWAIKPMNLFKIFVPEEANDERSRAYLMVEVDSQGKSTGVYRWNLSGTDNLTVNVPLSDVIPLPQAEEFNISLETKACDINLRDNSSSSEWEDLEDLLAGGKIIGSRGHDDDSHDVIGKSLHNT